MLLPITSYPAFNQVYLLLGVAGMVATPTLTTRELARMIKQSGIDFLNLPNGKKITVPFDQLIVFSTNLEPRELVDEAFLRRVPYKIEIVKRDSKNPSGAEAKVACPHSGTSTAGVNQRRRQPPLTLVPLLPPKLSNGSSGR